MTPEIVDVRPACIDVAGQPVVWHRLGTQVVPLTHTKVAWFACGTCESEVEHRGWADAFCPVCGWEGWPGFGNVRLEERWLPNHLWEEGKAPW